MDRTATGRAAKEWSDSADTIAPAAPSNVLMQWARGRERPLLTR
jgi:hypothetical protein